MTFLKKIFKCLSGQQSQSQSQSSDWFWLTDWFPRLAMKHPRRTCFPTRTEIFPELIAGSMNGSKDKDDVGIETDPEKKAKSFFKMKQ